MDKGLVNSGSGPGGRAPSGGEGAPPKRGPGVGDHRVGWAPDSGRARSKNRPWSLSMGPTPLAVSKPWRKKSWSRGAFDDRHGGPRQQNLIGLKARPGPFPKPRAPTPPNTRGGWSFSIGCPEGRVAPLRSSSCLREPLAAESGIFPGTQGLSIREKRRQAPRQTHGASIGKGCRAGGRCRAFEDVRGWHHRGQPKNFLPAQPFAGAMWWLGNRAPGCRAFHPKGKKLKPASHPSRRNCNVGYPRDCRNAGPSLRLCQGNPERGSVGPVCGSSTGIFYAPSAPAGGQGGAVKGPSSFLAPKPAGGGKGQVKPAGPKPRFTIVASVRRGVHRPFLPHCVRAWCPSIGRNRV